jgi:hypothetical protein
MEEQRTHTLAAEGGISFKRLWWRGWEQKKSLPRIGTKSKAANYKGVLQNEESGTCFRGKSQKMQFLGATSIISSRTFLVSQFYLPSPLKKEQPS